MEANMAGDDASLDAAVALIAKKVSADDVGAEPAPRRDARESRADRDPTEADDFHVLDDLEALEKAERAKAGESGERAGEEPAKGEAEEADAIDQFIELPTSEDGKAPERVPLSEAVEAVQKIRQMQGEIDTAVIKAEEDAFSKQDQITQGLLRTFSTLEHEARTAIEMMNAYAPREPDPRMYASTEDYYQAKLDFDAYWSHYQKVTGTIRQAQEGAKLTTTHADREYEQREMARAARFIPEFKDEKTRDARKSQILDALGPKFGITKDMLDDIVDHRGWRVLDALAKSISTERAAPEVRKNVQEKIPKLVNGRLPERDKSSGRFVSEARKAHKTAGTEESLARLLLSSGALNGL